MGKMLQSERMRKVVITVPKSFLDKTINELYKLNAVHIINHSKSDLDIGNPLESASKISEALIAARSLISNLGLAGSMELNNGFKAIGVKSLSHLTKSLKTLQNETNLKLEKAKQISDEISSIETKKNILFQLEKLGISVESYSNYSSITVLAGYVKNPDLMKTGLLKETDEFEMHSSSGSGFIALFVSNSFKDKAIEVLAKHEFSEFDLTPVKDIKGKPSEAISALLAEHELLQKSKLAIQKQLARIGAKWHDFLLLSEKFLSIELEKAEAPLRFASSENIFVVTGWVPAKNLVKLVEKAKKTTKGNIEIEIKQPAHDEEVPVKLSNTKLAKPFEFLMNLYALPKYAEIDPTLFLFITFPLFFGIILGDVGYGITVVLLLLYLSRKFPSAKPLARIIMPAAISSIFFGFIFGEVFGFEELFGYSIPHLISRVHQIQEMLIISIAIGLIHINLGLLTGFINELNHGLKKAILAKGSWWILQLSIGIMAASSEGLLPVPMYAGGILAVVSVIMIYLGESVSGLTELPGFFSNILSYSRLMAVGLASVGLAVVVNGFVEEFASAGGIMIFVAVIVGVIGHTLNIALGLLGGFLQSLRLHYVEFFTKFFKGGAIPFKPFGKITKEAAET
ncbi:V-type ATP synthase subunit I [Candidatus Woesearchaeota archaeon]|nr:V-type ATP synthase subunit I [Candidatus Woesearchaeota archaeon]